MSVLSRLRGAGATPRRSARIAIIGAGFSGLGTAVYLRRAGFSEITIFDKADSVGGVWRDNDYPGAACDVQSHLYSLSFAPNPDWTRQFSPQAEIWEYLERVADDHGLRSLLQLSTEITRAQWQPDSRSWSVTTDDGRRLEYDHLVVATGALAEPSIPDIDGLDSFSGPVFHSARWRHDVDLKDARVAVIGTGASAIQFVPAIQPEVAHLELFQRTPPWIMPRHDGPISAERRRLLKRIPGLQRLLRAGIFLEREYKVIAFRHPALIKAFGESEARRHLHKQVSDPELRTVLTPTYRMGCKRTLLSNDYYPAVAAPNVHVNTTGVERVTESAVVDRGGVEHEVDAVILGTGFVTDRLPLTDRILDADGTSLSEHWGVSPTAYLGTSVAGWPNLFLMHGPNIGLGHTSVIMMLESQMRYVAAAISGAASRGATVSPTQRAQHRFVDLVARLGRGTVWTAGGCSSWYLDETGRNTNIWPGFVLGFRRRARHFSRADHEIVPAPMDAESTLSGQEVR